MNTTKRQGRSPVRESGRREPGWGGLKQLPAAELERRVANWNKLFPIGTRVTRYAWVNPLREPTETKTASEAWVMGGHSAVVMVEGVSGGVSLESVVPK